MPETGPPGGPPPAPESIPAPEFAGRQRTLYEALSRRSVRLANVYLGAIRVLEQSDNPDRLALCAHGLRELIEKLHWILDLPVAVRATNLRNEVRRLEERWDQFSGRHGIVVPDTYDEAYTSDLSAILAGLSEFFRTAAMIAPRRRDELRRVLRGLDVAGGPLAPPIEEALIDRLQGYYGYFAGVAHHTHEAPDGAFREQLLAFEVFLMERLAPRTYEEFDEIDQIIEQGDSNANP